MFPEITRDDVFRLETERLWLRWPRAADADEIRQHVGDPDVALMTASIPHPYAPHDADAFIASVREENGAGGGLHLVITPKNRPNEPIGLVSLAWRGPPRRGDARILARQALLGTRLYDRGGQGPHRPRLRNHLAGSDRLRRAAG